MINKKLAKPYKVHSVEYLYCQNLTTFAFEKVERQLKFIKSCNDFEFIGDDTFLAVTPEGLIQVSPLNCECLFRKSTQLPCKHIFYCRQLLALPLFDINVCLNRWTRSYLEKILDAFADNENYQSYETETTISENNCKPKLTNHAKFKLMYEEGKKMAQLCSEVSTSIFF